jgi:hypothetical protein
MTSITVVAAIVIAALAFSALVRFWQGRPLSRDPQDDAEIHAMMDRVHFEQLRLPTGYSWEARPQGQDETDADFAERRAAALRP